MVMAGIRNIRKKIVLLTMGRNRPSARFM